MSRYKDIAKKINLEPEIIKKYIEANWLIIEDDCDELDIARIKLIYQLENDFEMQEESVDVVLNLMDQIYGLRAYIKKLSTAIDKQPKEVQAEIFAYIKKLEE